MKNMFVLKFLHYYENHLLFRFFLILASYLIIKYNWSSGGDFGTD